MRSRTLPLTCTTMVTVVLHQHRRVRDRPGAGRGRARPPWRGAHSSAVTWGVAGASSSSRVSTATSSVGPCDPAVGLHVAVELVEEGHVPGHRHVVGPAVEVVGVCPSIRRWAAAGHLRVGVAGVTASRLGAPASSSEPGTASRHSRCRKRLQPSRPKSSQSTSSSGGFTARWARRSASAPRVSMISSGATRLPLDFDILAPSEADHALGEQPLERLAQLRRARSPGRPAPW